MGGIAMRRVAEFDALRGIAVLGVLIFHLRPDQDRSYLGMAGAHLFDALHGPPAPTVHQGHDTVGSTRATSDR
jgi:peptidoglycan/LPS O-acetylase OafA/YrhL